MLENIFTKELFYALLFTFIIYLIFKRVNLITMQRKSEGMMNVEFHTKDDFNV
jgi:hypothetical protein